MKNFGIDVKNGIHYLYFPQFWENGTIAATSLRLGGFSSKPYSSLNMGLHTEDKSELVIKNRKKFFALFGINYKKIVTLKQIHSNKVISVTKADIGKGALNYNDSLAEADGMVTDKPNIPLVIFTADCVPIFFLEKKKKIIGIAHSGWKGSLKNISKQVIKIIVDMGGDKKSIITALGPAIGKCCYEVKEDFTHKFDKKYIDKRNKKYYLDLYKINVDNLINEGILKENIFSSNFCTVCNNNLCFSYRKEGETGRMASVIMVSGKY